MLIYKIITEFEARIRDRKQYHLSLVPIKDEIKKSIEKLQKLLKNTENNDNNIH